MNLRIISNDDELLMIIMKMTIIMKTSLPKSMIRRKI